MSPCSISATIVIGQSLLLLLLIHLVPMQIPAGTCTCGMGRIIRGADVATDDGHN
ncbi:uncharacterized protein ARMOST_07536 [Armillaria ostoyae]|uniref:Uncharacterized protein n=1 Tax=Armillaria ostoyae TaxID=47428 RepID=A0A284R634_ARMOS|nr:uncharacterized protein ARMOST_07536 [Armillaria ostoyae]